MRKTKVINYWIHYSYALENGDEIKSSVICDKYTEVLGKIVTESREYFNSDIVRSCIIPSNLVDSIILYDKNGKEVDRIAFR